MFPMMEPMVGYAATIKIRGSAPPTAAGSYPDRTDLWDYLQSLPSPRVAVVQDEATQVGLGTFVDAVSINILYALGCHGVVTNGSVRDLPEARRLGFQLFASHAAVSHTYIHVVEFGTPVAIAGLKVNSGDLIHGDQHGIQTVPLEIVPQLPAVAARIRAEQQSIISVCQSPAFSLEALREAVARRNT
jgi:regulator of RNase E activity RraA